jgi:hypothetical protein
MEDKDTKDKADEMITDEQSDKKENIKKNFSVAKNVKRSDGKLYTVVKLFS